MGFLNLHLFRIGQTEVTVSTLLISVAILVATLVLSRLTRNVIAQRLLARTHLAAGARYAVGRVAGYLVFFVGAMLALNALGVNATSLAAFGAAVGVGLGFGLQDIVKNFVAGIIVLLERPIMVGDRIEVGQVVGDVVEIRTRSTVVCTNDEVYLIVPNAKFISEPVTNWSFRSSRIRVKIPVGVASDSNPREVEAALIEAAARSDAVLKDPAPKVYFQAFGEYTLDFQLLCWTSTMLHTTPTLQSDLNFLIWEELSRRGIEIPNPQRDLHIRSADGLERAFSNVAVGTSGMEPAKSDIREVQR
jgi:small-conductance mechanosensitive channel